MALSHVGLAVTAPLWSKLLEWLHGARLAAMRCPVVAVLQVPSVQTGPTTAAHEHALSNSIA